MPNPQIQILACFAVAAVVPLAMLVVCMVAFGDWKPIHTRLALKLGNVVFCLLSVAVISRSQTQPAWAQQQQVEDIRQLRRDVEQIRADVRDNTKDVGFLEKNFENGQRIDSNERATMRADLGDHETRLREIESRVNWAYAIFSVAVFVAPAIFQLLMWGFQNLRRNGRNGHITGAHK